jgi:5'-deoxynucleotidase YfbR-like HD superfamily hydrolase
MVSREGMLKYRLEVTRNKLVELKDEIQLMQTCFEYVQELSETRLMEQAEFNIKSLEDSKKQLEDYIVVLINELNDNTNS